ncbi:tetratricopeptide repeat protein [Mucilaginibacter sp. SP1R1]|uniref:tetratricopeptide repeat protein n=1 Tax=Mucilaginibacter sp. SP1R1 TaxID=2723091 RepID=UPI00161A74AC|nr:tetratricopeptide repeat protein [Mucilaginibacter sp. SP1R1]MBB6151698.1 tetratricopeptide (TPR) repeat protein [Mucilaginibacter sp. SP1R1]
MIKKHLLILCLLFCSAAANASFIFNKNCADAYNAILSLKMTEARQIIQLEKKQNPQNGMTILLDNYVDYFSLLASDSKADYEKLKDNKSGRISALEDNTDQKSPYYLYAQAEVYLQWGLCKGRFGDYMSSASDIKKAGNLFKENAQKFPDFLPNQKGIALVNVVFGSIPSNLKSITQFLGMKGDAQLGIKQMEQLRVELPKTKYSYLKDEVVFFVCYIDIDLLHHKNNYDKLISYISGMDNQSLLKTYLQGYVAAKTAHNEDAIRFLEDSPESAQYIKLPAIYYLLGNAKLNRMDTDAPNALNKYLREYKGVNFIKDTYLKLGYFYLLHNDNEKYQYYLKLVRTKGYTADEKDKQALKEANDVRPDSDLLKARFYFDGGYYLKALAQLKNKNVYSLRLQRDKIELYYRLGRIYENTDNTNDALINYQQTINLGKATTYYYAANAALRIGSIFEQKKDYTRAANFYHQAIDMKDHEYEKSIENDAKEGLKRMNR